MLIALNYSLILNLFNALNNTACYCSKSGIRASCATMLGLYAGCSFSKDLNLQSNFTRVGHCPGDIAPLNLQMEPRSLSCQPLALKGFAQSLRDSKDPRTYFCWRVSFPLKLKIPPIFVPKIIVGDRVHDSHCSVDSWNVVARPELQRLL